MTSEPHTRSHTFTVRPTRFRELGYTHVEPGLWRFVDTTDARKPTEPPRCVGPFYASKAELLADIDRYARESWGLK